MVPPGTPGANPAGDFTSWATAATNIADAVAVATNNSVVLVSNGTYRLPAMIELTTAITLRSFNAGAIDPAGTIIDGGFPDASNRCLYVNNAAAVIDGLTITNGYALAASLNGRGGGIYLNRKGVVSNCVIAGNEATGAGGGVFLNIGGLVTACKLVGNVATNGNLSGGGAYLYADGTITNSRIEGNTARYGGGAYLFSGSSSSGSAALRDCDIIGNTAWVVESGQGGGGVHGTWRGYVSDCRIVSNKIVAVGKTGYVAGITLGGGSEIRNCLVAYNTGAGYGGGIQIGNGIMASNCVVRNNSAGNGGGVYLNGGLLTHSVVVSNNMAFFVQGGTARNCLIAGNTDGIRDFNVPGGLYQNCTIVGNGYGIDIGWSTYTVTSKVENCILYYNGSSGINYTMGSAAGIILTNTCTLPIAAGATDSGNITNAPRMVDVSGFDFRLRGSSPCIDKGVYRGWMAQALDLNHDRRIRGSAVDIGAFEYKASGSTFLVR